MQHVGRLLVAMALILGLELLAPARALAARTAQEPRRFGFSGTMAASSSFLEAEDPDYSSTLDLILTPTYKMSEAYKASFTIWISQELDGHQENSLFQTDLGVSWAGRQITPSWKFSNSVGIMLPISKERRERESLYLGLRTTPKLAFDLSGQGKPISGYYSLGFSKFFHEYDSATNGRSNILFSIGQEIGLAWTPSAIVTVSTSFTYHTSWTYENNTIGKFSFSPELGIQPSEALALAVGISTDGNVLRANGQDSNIAFFDKYASSFYGSVTYSY